MHERLIIHHFGPIREASFEIRDLTVFIGAQASGKSLTAQLLYFMRWMEDIFLPELTAQRVDPCALVLGSLEWWIGNDIAIYCNEQTRIIYDANDQDETTRVEIWWDSQGAHLNDVLEERVHQFIVADKIPSPSIEGRYYIPAGRTLYSYVPPVISFRFLSRVKRRWPGVILTFYETLGWTIETLWHEQERRHRGQVSLFNVTPDAEFLRLQIDSILRGHLRYGPETILLEVGEKLFPAETLAAGQMKIWPFCAIVDAFLAGLSIQEIYFEEPEAHLHPDAQQQVMEIIAFLVRQGVRVVITTHNPHILYALNNILLAHAVQAAGHTLSHYLNEIAIPATNVAAYRFSREGHGQSCMQAAGGIIETHELDMIANDLRATFHDLHNQLQAYDPPS